MLMQRRTEKFASISIEVCF